LPSLHPLLSHVTSRVRQHQRDTKVASQHSPRQNSNSTADYSRDNYCQMASKRLSSCVRARNFDSITRCLPGSKTSIANCAAVGSKLGCRHHHQDIKTHAGVWRRPLTSRAHNLPLKPLLSAYKPLSASRFASSWIDMGSVNVGAYNAPVEEATFAGLLFDMDGTIIDSTDAVIQHWHG